MAALKILQIVAAVLLLIASGFAGVWIGKALDKANDRYYQRQRGRALREARR